MFFIVGRVLRASVGLSSFEILDPRQGQLNLCHQCHLCDLYQCAAFPCFLWFLCDLNIFVLILRTLGRPNKSVSSV